MNPPTPEAIYEESIAKNDRISRKFFNDNPPPEAVKQEAGYYKWKEEFDGEMCTCTWPSHVSSNSHYLDKYFKLFAKNNWNWSMTYVPESKVYVMYLKWGEDKVILDYSGKTPIEAVVNTVLKLLDDQELEDHYMEEIANVGGG